VHKSWLINGHTLITFNAPEFKPAGGCMNICDVHQTNLTHSKVTGTSSQYHTDTQIISPET